MPVKKSSAVRLAKQVSRSPREAGQPSVKAKKTERKTTNEKRTSALSVPVYSLSGRESGSLALPKEVFGQKVNKVLLSQAIRVYMTNQKILPGSTKTRGEVEGSTAKIYRQKGTGRARHGGIRAPIFVGGGITFGPKPRKIRLSLPQNMKRAALVSALSDKAFDRKIFGLSGLEKASGKTREMVKLMSSVIRHQTSDKKDKKRKQASGLIVTEGKADNVVRSVKNIPGVDVSPVNLINAYDVLRHDLLMVTKEVVEKLSGKEVKKEKGDK